MKKLYIKQKVFKITDHYSVMDEHQKEIYKVDQDFKMIGNTVHVKDATGQEVFVVNKEIFTLLPKYEVRFTNGQVVYLKSQFTFLKKKISVESSEMSLVLKGDFFDHHFSLYDGEKLLGTVKEEYLTWGDTFELTIYDESKQDIIVAIMIAVDCIRDSEQK